MLCARQCPDWCIYIEGHKEKRPPRREGGRDRTVSVLDRFDIDYALCMYCGICVEVCPFDALFWSPEYEYSEPQHRQAAPRQGEARRVDGDRARARAARDRRRGQGQEVVVMWAQNVAFWILAVAMVARRDRRRALAERRARRAVPRRRARRRRRAVHPARGRVRRLGAGAHLHRRDRHPVPVRDHAHPRADAAATAKLDNDQRWPAAVVSLFLFGVLAALLVDAFGDDEIELEDTLVSRQHRAASADAIFQTYVVPVRGRVDAAARRARRRRRDRAEGLTG